MSGRYGIGASVVGRAKVAAGNAPPVYPSNGSGGPGILGAATVVRGGAANEISDLTAGRITLAMVEVAFIGLVAFYLWTRTSQGG